MIELDRDQAPEELARFVDLDPHDAAFGAQHGGIQRRPKAELHALADLEAALRADQEAGAARVAHHADPTWLVRGVDAYGHREIVPGSSTALTHDRGTYSAALAEPGSR